MTKPHPTFFIHCQAVRQLLTLPLKFVSTMKFNRANGLRSGWWSTDSCWPSLLCGAWLIKLVVKGEKIHLAQICVMKWWMIKWYRLVLDASGTWWLGQYKFLLLGIRWHRVSIGLLWPFDIYSMYTEKKVEIWSGVTNPWHTHSFTHRQQNIVLLRLSKV